MDLITSHFLLSISGNMRGKKFISLGMFFCCLMEIDCLWDLTKILRINGGGRRSLESLTMKLSKTWGKTWEREKNRFLITVIL